MQPAHVSSLFQLEYPKPVVVVNDYETAQKVVDHLSDKEFPVENLCIVGTDLRSIERVIGRKTWGTVLGQGAISGVGMGLLVGLMMSFFYSLNSLVVMLLSGLLIGVVIGMITAAITYAMSRGERDYNSVQQVVATHYEVLAEHKVAQQARDLALELREVQDQVFNA
ncbi:general stress protein [Cutibacterium granulosum]|uniref:general stress protein n=1 Tax=Cutibacterium granulosum TaxID=33011 RepID=UPI002B230B89|nr:general stress protein [Cutibacterium granulosum]